MWITSPVITPIWLCSVSHRTEFMETCQRNGEGRLKHEVFIILESVPLQCSQCMLTFSHTTIWLVLIWVRWPLMDSTYRNNGMCWHYYRNLDHYCPHCVFNMFNMCCVVCHYLACFVQSVFFGYWWNTGMSFYLFRGWAKPRNGIEFAFCNSSIFES